MIKKQLLFALRRLGRHKLTTGINLLGLTFGILACMVIYLYVAYEFSYDRFHPDADRIYRLVSSIRAPGLQDENAMAAAPVGAALRQRTTAFSAVTTLFTDDTRVLIPVAAELRLSYLDALVDLHLRRRRGDGDCAADSQRPGYPRRHRQSGEELKGRVKTRY